MSHNACYCISDQDHVCQHLQDGMHVSLQYCLAWLCEGLLPEFLTLPCAGSQHRDSDYLVIDINYFPGYEKLPGYEAMMVDFLQTLAAESKQSVDGGLDGASRLKHAVSQTPVRTSAPTSMAVPL